MNNLPNWFTAFFKDKQSAIDYLDEYYENLKLEWKDLFKKNKENEMENMSTEKPSSIEVSRNAKGEYSFKVKIYFEGFSLENKAVSIDVNDHIKGIYNDLLMRFK